MPFRLYLDEVGNDDLGNCDDNRYRFLSLTGVAIDTTHSRDWLIPHMDRFKRNVLAHPDPDNPPILHRKEIYQKKGPFGILNDPQACQRFDEGILWILRQCEYKVITVVIDKLEMQNQDHWQNTHPYHYLMEILVEKYTQWLERKGSYGDIMPEKRY